MNTLAAIVINGMSIGQIAIYIVVAAAIIALVYVALQQFGIAIPPWVVQIFWIMVVACVVVLAIRIVMGI